MRADHHTLSKSLWQTGQGENGGKCGDAIDWSGFHERCGHCRRLDLCSPRRGGNPVTLEFRLHGGPLLPGRRLCQHRGRRGQPHNGVRFRRQRLRVGGGAGQRLYVGERRGRRPGAPGVTGLCHLHPAEHSSAFVQGVQGYRWSGSTGIDIAFSGIVDFQGAGPGFVTAGLAIADTSVRDLSIGTQWAVGSNDGAFSATCATPGGIALVNSGRRYAAGANSFGIDTSNGSCLPGSAVFHVEPGQEFFVFARLLAFGLADGTRDASHTFTIGLSPTLSEETQASIHQYLTPFQPLAAVPEPSTWASMIFGFGAIGTAIRRLRKGRGDVRFAPLPTGA